MEQTVNIVGAGLAGSEAALRLASLGFMVRLFEMRPLVQTPVHCSANCAELVCSNSLKSLKAESAAGMLKEELAALHSPVFDCALQNRVAAGGALAVDREAFAGAVSGRIMQEPAIELIRGEVCAIYPDGSLELAANGERQRVGQNASALILASGPLTGDALAAQLEEIAGTGHLAFYDAAAPIVLADSLDMDKLFSQSRYEEGGGDYLNAPFSKDEYERFIEELLSAKRVIAKDFESKELFQACQPIEEIARAGLDAPRFGSMKPVGLRDPKTGKRPWAALQLRAEDAHGQSYNLVGFQTNLTFPEQERVFRLIPGLGQAEFARFGVMHRNTFIDAPKLLGPTLRFRAQRDASAAMQIPLFVAGQLSGTEGYCEAIRSGAHAAICTAAACRGIEAPIPAPSTVFGALLAYSTNPETKDYQPMHVNFGIIEPLQERVKNKGERYARYARRGAEALQAYVGALQALGLLAG